MSWDYITNEIFVLHLHLISMESVKSYFSSLKGVGGHGVLLDIREEALFLKMVIVMPYKALNFNFL